MPGSSKEILQLPVLQEVYNGTDHMQTKNYLVDRHLTKKQLKELLKTYHLPCSGTREDMLERLRDYASHPERWAENYQAAPMRVRGRMKGSRARGTVAKRTRAQFGEDNEAVQYPCKRAMVHAPDRRTDSDITNQRELARGFLAHAEAMKASMSSTIASMTEPARPALPDDDSFLALGLPPVPKAAGSDAASIARLEQQIQRMETTLNVISSRLQVEPKIAQNSDDPLRVVAWTVDDTGGTRKHDLAVVPESSAITTIQFESTACTRLQEQSSVQSAFPVAPRAVYDSGVALANASESTDVAPVQTKALSSASSVRRLQFDEVILTFDSSAVPDPPIGLSYSGRKLDQLFEDWYASAHLTIAGHPIALRHWPLVYQCRAGFKKHAWHKYRSTWHNWKYLVEEYEALGSNKEAFWAKHSGANGERLSYHKILETLKAERKTTLRDDGPVADEARMFFGGDLQDPRTQGRFTYRGKRGTQVCTTDKEVAKRWRQALDDDEDLRAQWEEWKTSLDAAVA